MILIIGVLKTNFMLKKILFFNSLVFIIVSCNNQKEVKVEKIDESIPVTITRIDTSALQKSITLNATATYLVKNMIKANATGYLTDLNVAVNDFVKKGEILFAIKTREAKTLGNTINKLDPSLNFGQAIKVKSNTNGNITILNVHEGDYVQDGDALLTVNDINSFALMLSIPFELRKHIAKGQRLDVMLPDGTKRTAIVENFSPNVDISSQTQNAILKINGIQNIPENLIVTVIINQNKKSISLPKSAILTDETVHDFWIMKMISSNTAIKVPIQKGFETEDRIEIISPVLSPKDKILSTGNYGVADTIKVKVINN